MLSLDISTLSGQVHAACLLEAAAPKAGNVHPGASFSDLKFEHFSKSAEVVAPIVSQVRELGIGNTILKAVQETRKQVQTNTNLGILLLITPLAAIPEGVYSSDGIGEILDCLSMHDTCQIYEAIRHANPGGLGDSAEQDIAEPPTVGIVEAMSLAASFDLVARQYVNQYHEVLSIGRQFFLEEVNQYASDWQTAILVTQLKLLATYPDSLIIRKCGEEIAQESQRLAQDVLKQGWPHRSADTTKYQQFDDWLRADGHRRNPGTTADLIAAILFAVIRDQDWIPPNQINVSLSSS